MKTVLIGIAVVIGLALWHLISSRFIGTPVVPISELNHNTKEHCGKVAIVKGKVLQLAGDSGYEIGQDGVTLYVAVGKPNGKARPLPSVGKNIEAHVVLVCDTGRALAMGASFSELP